MANLILNERRIAEAQSGWAAPTPPSPGGQVWAPPSTGPASDGPVSAWRGAMTVQGTLTATAILFAILLASATAGWIVTGGPERGIDGSLQYSFPGIAFVGIAVGFASVLVLMAKPHLAKFIAPVYAVGQGFAVGAISRYYETFFDGIVLQAAGATLGVLGVMLFLYRSRIIRVTDRLRRTIVFATLGVMAFYLVSFVMNIFGGGITFFNQPNAIGILFSVGVALLAAFNLLLDFDFIERGTKSGLSKDFEWFAAFGLLVTIVWLYLEILRLLAKLQSRN